MIILLIPVSINYPQSISTPPSFDKKHGFYDSPFELKISSSQPGSKIYFTTDGSEPSEKNGSLYSSAILIITTTILRAVAIVPGFLPGDITTATYLFPDDVIYQSNTQPGYPSKWGPYTAIPDTAIADYGMDSEITRDPKYSGLMKDALLSIPTISIVTDKNNLFSKSTDPEKGGIYIYTGPPGNDDKPLQGIDWERTASIEYFTKDGDKEFQADCGLKIHGGHSRRPEKSPKHSFRITFSSKYGISKLKFPLFGDDATSGINTFILRASYGNTWIHMSSSERLHTQLIHDLWGKDTQLEMGHPSGHGNFVHLYINGLYWGIYNPTERIDKNFAAVYMGGNENDFDIIKDYGEIVDGDKNAWDAMLSLIKKGLSDNESYMRIQGKNADGSVNPSYPVYLDVVNLIDYMILNFYGANWDWDHHNWIAARNRVQPDKGFKFFSWDAEHINESVTSNILNENNANCPSSIFQKLRENSEFRKLFADRIQKHCFDGVLTPETGKARWLKRAAEIELAIIAESARWGDYRRDVHRWAGGPYVLYTKEHWLTELYFLTNTYFPQRTNEFIKQLRNANLFPSINTPSAAVNGQPVVSSKIKSGDKLTLSGSGTIYYTLDGNDPLNFGQISPTAKVYSSEIELNYSIHLKARSVRDNEWSPLRENIFILPSDPKGLRIIELHYHPLAQDTIADKEYEFLEIKNISSLPIDMSGMKFINGITYSFPINSILESNQLIVLASNKQRFYERYNFYPFGQYDGSLDNSGERVVFTSAFGDTIFSFRYNDKYPWPEDADGKGYSLVAGSGAGIENPADAKYWRTSNSIHGSPGKDDLATDIHQANYSIPTGFYLYQNYPNPFNPETVISYQLPVASFVTLKVYDILGREVATLVDEFKQPGKYNSQFSILNYQLTSGIYFYKLTSGNFTAVKKMILIK